jgi:hypothetical protein
MEAPSLADQQRVWVCGCWALGVVCWALGVGCWVLGVGCVGVWVLGVVCWVLGIGRWVLGVGCWVLGVGRWALGVGRWALGVGRWVLGVGCSFPFSVFSFSAFSVCGNPRDGPSVPLRGLRVRGEEFSLKGKRGHAQVAELEEPTKCATKRKRQSVRQRVRLRVGRSVGARCHP